MRLSRCLFGKQARGLWLGTAAPRPRWGEALSVDPQIPPWFLMHVIYRSHTRCLPRFNYHPSTLVSSFPFKNVPGGWWSPLFGPVLDYLFVLYNLFVISVTSWKQSIGPRSPCWTRNSTHALEPGPQTGPVDGVYLLKISFTKYA